MPAEQHVPLFGLYVPQLHMPVGDIEARAVAAERAGFDSIWLMDHLAPPRAAQLGMWEGLELAAFLAARTSTIDIGHLVLCSEFRHPAVLAKCAVTLDHLSDGRFTLGLGWGSWPDELARFGISSDSMADRSDRMRETLEILQLLFTGEEVSYGGRWFQLRGARQLPAPVRGHIPVLIGGAGATLTLPLVARFADWWNCPADRIRELDGLRPLAGRARVSTQHPIGMAWRPSERDAVREQTAKRFRWGGDAIITGTADEVVAALAARARSGVEMFIVPFGDRARPDTIRRFGDEVIPAVRAAVQGLPGRVDGESARGRAAVATGCLACHDCTPLVPPR
jgi:alkanesulfonate monooxygenase SsuD/methylene tetrahydromethanopterin reductase-like flavin-dependent oxidoreductase (luciferase family)